MSRGRSSLLFVALLALSVPARAGEVRYLSTADYFDAVAAEIHKATSSVSVCLYLFNLSDRPDAKTSRLAEALMDARRRGVKVEVLLDSAVSFEDGVALPQEDRNRSAYDALRGGGVDVFFSSSPRVVHAKTVVVDDSVVIAGSFNWSEAALSSNVEGALLARDADAAKAALADMRRIGRRTLPEEPPAALVPLSFLTDPKRLGTMVANGDERSFDAYLFLLKRGAGTPAFDVDETVLAEELGMTGLTTRPRRLGIRRVLGRLRDSYGLVRFEFPEGSGIHLEILPSTGAAVGLPPEYWTWGWNRSLRLPGKVLFLLNRRYSAASNTRPSWSLPEREISRENGVSALFVSKGTTELRRTNLVKVVFDKLDRNGGEPRQPSVYTPLPLYDPAALERKWNDLAARCGADKLARARRCLALVYADSDASAAEMFIGLEDEYGRAKVDQAYEIIAQKSGSNPRRTVGYFIGVVKGLESESR